MRNKTKIIATIGPSCCSDEKLKKAIEEGANIIRFNMKHSTMDWHSKYIEKTTKIAKERNIPIGIMIDLQGPEIRIEIKNEKGIGIERGDKITFSDHFIDEKTVLVPNKKVLQVLKKGDKILIDDGFLRFKVIEIKEKGRVVAEAKTDGIIHNYKGLNLPGKKIDLPSLIKDDLKKLDLAAKHEIDFVALSFTRGTKDIEVLKKEMKKRKIKAKIIAKIENQEALNNIDQIIEKADGIMIARGDLGVETPLEEIAYVQKNTIQKCRNNHTPVIVATQMLESMISNPLPTRAEVTDVANAVFNGTDAVMLSAETASGQYPIEAIRTMNKILSFNEKKSTPPNIEFTKNYKEKSLVNSALGIIQSPSFPKIDKVLAFTKNGDIVRAISALRPSAPILTVTDKEKTLEELLCSFGIVPHYNIFPEKNFKNEDLIIKELYEKNLIKKGETILILHDHTEKSLSLTNLSFLK